MKIIIITAVYIAGFLLTYSASFAHFQRKYPYIAEESYRQDLGFAIFMALLPLCWLVVFFMTGFYQWGFKFK